VSEEETRRNAECEAEVARETLQNTLDGIKSNTDALFTQLTDSDNSRHNTNNP